MNREWISRTVFQICAGLVIAVLFLVYLFVATQAYQTFTVSHISFSAFFFGNSWDSDTQFGVLVFITGSLIIIALGLFIAVPLAIGSSIFITEVAPNWLGNFLRSVVELFLGIPSVIFGLLGLTVLVPFIRNVLNTIAGGRYYNGYGVIPASIVVAFMVLPTITTITIDTLRALPRELREGSLALGATRWQMITKTLVPAATPGMLNGVILGGARILGETVAVAFVIGGATGYGIRFLSQPPYLYLGPTSVLTTNLLFSFKDALPPSDLYNALWTLSFTLLLISGITIGASRIISSRKVY